jgi:succinyl-CoA synthetase beta subunit
MDLMEYKVRALYQEAGIPANRGVVVDNLDLLDPAVTDLAFPLVIKAQVQTGGRGKAGGIRFAENKDELWREAARILGMDIRGHQVDRLFIAEKAEILDECYLGLVLDRLSKRPMFLFSRAGGVDIEETARNHPEQVIRLPFDPLAGYHDYLPRYLAGKSGLDAAYLPAFTDLVKKMTALFVARDCTLLEINPLGLQADGALIAIDGKASIDDSALFRHPDLLAWRDTLPEDPFILEARRFNFLYIPCEKDGDIAVMSNGSGMIMSCIDQISQAGFSVVAALDLGGGATSSRIVEAIRIVLGNPQVTTLFINIFGGITRCDEVAGGISQAMENQPADKLVIVRLEGTNKEQGLQVLAASRGDIRIVESIAGGVRIMTEGRSKA